ncbi:hypothetical protein MRB53_016728 [Persea americana]|uniref:Uncharacterized protein n=1 Tax=Persea americana TaxID=3435 RepID=A0ACC2M3Y4_PERAE|nr:hypothetical protein MRB53_016728 [Persea americana]
MDVVFDESKLHYSTIGFESADVPENVLQSTNSDDALCFDINSVTISTSANTRESLEDKTTVDNPQVSSDQCENSPHLPDSTLSPLAPVSSSSETLQQRQRPETDAYLPDPSFDFEPHLRFKEDADRGVLPPEESCDTFTIWKAEEADGCLGSVSLVREETNEFALDRTGDEILGTDSLPLFLAIPSDDGYEDLKVEVGEEEGKVVALVGLALSNTP